MAKSRGRKTAAKPTKPTKTKKKPAPKKPKKPAKPTPKKRKPLTPEQKRQRALNRRDKLNEEARKAGARKRNLGGLTTRLANALELAQDMASERGYPSNLITASPPREHEELWWTPWVLVGQYEWLREIGYAELHEILSRWSLRKLETKIDKERIARIVVHYKTDRGKQESYVLSESQPWAYMLARAMDECDPSDVSSYRRGGLAGSLASRYPGSKIESIYVWLSEGIGTNAMKKIRTMKKKRQG
jgi:hypothetical protein